MSVQFVADVSSNHNHDLNRCYEFIECASAMGCSAVKFQLFKVKSLFAPEILAKSDEHSRRESWELPTEFLPQLSSRCKDAGIQFACTPFYLKAVEELFPYVNFYKIASYELLWEDLLSACAKTGKPVVLSTGMATLEETIRAVEVLVQSGCTHITILHCVSSYPVPVMESNLAAIETIQSTVSAKQLSIKTEFGWSDHSVNPGVLFRAIHRWGASMIEFHLDLDGNGNEYSNGHCWLPDEIKLVIEQSAQGFLADGSGLKNPMSSEMPDRDWRADPEDGLRPMRTVRKSWKK